MCWGGQEQGWCLPLLLVPFFLDTGSHCIWSASLLRSDWLASKPLRSVSSVRMIGTFGHAWPLCGSWGLRSSCVNSGTSSHRDTPQPMCVMLLIVIIILGKCQWATMTRQEPSEDTWLCARWASTAGAASAGGVAFVQLTFHSIFWASTKSMVGVLAFKWFRVW